MRSHQRPHTADTRDQDQIVLGRRYDFGEELGKFALVQWCPQCFQQSLVTLLPLLLEGPLQKFAILEVVDDEVQ